MRRILFLDTNTEIGGVVTVLLALLRRLERGRLKLTVAAQAGGRPEPALRAIPDLHVVSAHFGTKPSDLRSRPLARTYDLLALPVLALTVARLALLVLVRRIDVIHTSDKVKSVLVGWALSTLTRKPLVYHVHAVCVPTRINRLALARASRIVANSQAMKDDFIRCLGSDMERIEVVHNGVEVERELAGVDLRAELGIPDDAVVVGAASRLAPNKGQADLIEAAAAVLRDAPDTVFLLAGDDSIDDGNSGYRAHLEGRCAELGIAEHVRFLGFVDDMDAFYRTTDIVVDAAWEEPFGMVVIEPMVFGRPVIGTDAGGIPEIIDHDSNGLLVAPRAPADLARAITALALDHDHRERLGRGARASVAARFDVALQAERMTAILEEAAT